MAMDISYHKNNGNICRLCLKQGETMTPIFNATDSEDNYNFFANRITSIAHVEINDNDGLPTTICEACKKLVDQFYEFRVQVEISDKELRSSLKTPQVDIHNEDNLSDSNSNSKDMIYALFMPNDERMQMWDISNVLQSPEQMNKIIQTKYLSDSENVENFDEVTAIANEISCELCSISFASLSDLKNHIIDHCSIREKEIFDDDSVNNLIAIDETTMDNEWFNIPNQQDINQRIIDSDEINTDNTSTEDNNELKKILNGTKLKCKYCDKLFSNVTLIMHNEKCRFRKKELVCDECGKQFRKRSELRYHKGTHLTTPLTCEYCNKQFRNIQSFSIHVKRHTHGTRYHCETCGKSYYTNSELARHVQMHLDKRKHPCHLCDMSFLSQPELNRHLQYHNGIKRFECNVCSKSYYESGHLKVHQRIHTGERPFVCQLCNKGFITRSKLVRHTKVHRR